MLTALLTGFFLGLSLIIAIGAQNAFVLRQGVLRQHVFFIALFCSISDALLIILGVLGISYFFNDFFNDSFIILSYTFHCNYFRISFSIYVAFSTNRYVF